MILKFDRINLSFKNYSISPDKHNNLCTRSVSREKRSEAYNIQFIN